MLNYRAKSRLVKLHRKSAMRQASGTNFKICHIADQPVMFGKLWWATMAEPRSAIYPITSI